MSDCPSALEPASVECVSCRGAGCGACGDSGAVELTSCARRQVDRQTWELLRWVLRAEEGKGLPEDGGLLSQARSFVDAWDFVAGEMAHWTAKLRNPNRAK